VAIAEKVSASYTPLMAKTPKERLSDLRARLGARLIGVLRQSPVALTQREIAKALGVTREDVSAGLKILALGEGKGRLVKNKVPRVTVGRPFTNYCWKE
jgi:CRP-like cAMP-binding protein